MEFPGKRTAHGLTAGLRPNETIAANGSCRRKAGRRLDLRRNSVYEFGILVRRQDVLAHVPEARNVYHLLSHPSARDGFQGCCSASRNGVPQQQSAYDQAAATASASDLAAALASVGTFAYPAGSHHFAAGISPGWLVGPPGSSSVLRFLSTSDLNVTSATVPAGSTVTWTNLSNNEAHTVTFAPVGRPFPTLNPFAPPTGGNTYDGTTLVNSGLLFPGQSFSATFPKAGIYTYHCLLHDDTENMIATLVVQ